MPRGKLRKSRRKPSFGALEGRHWQFGSVSEEGRRSRRVWGTVSFPVHQPEELARELAPVAERLAGISVALSNGQRRDKAARIQGLAKRWWLSYSVLHRLMYTGRKEPRKAPTISWNTYNAL